MSKVNDKIQEIEKYLEELGSVLPSDFIEYKDDFRVKAICERYFEKIIEAVVDLAFLIIKDKSFKTPEDDKEAFDILANEEIISKELAEKLKDAKGMRNIIAHEYGKVDNEIVFHSVAEELGRDAEEFIESIERTK